MNLTEATMLAIQGKLKLDESKEVKKESIDVSVDDNGATIVETPEATVIVTDTQNVTEAPVEEVIVAEVPEEDEVETVEIPVEGDETIIPEEIVEPETEEPTIDEIVDGNTEEDLNESKKSCEDCGKEVCECDKIVEDVEVTSDGDVTLDNVEDIYKVNDGIFEIIQEAILEIKDEDMTEAKKKDLTDKLNEISSRVKNVNASLNKYMDSLEESKKSCEDCGKEVCECDKVEEAKEIKKEKIDINTGNSKFSLKIDLAYFYNQAYEKDETDDEELYLDVEDVKKILTDLASKLEYTDEGPIYYKDTKIGEYCFGYEGVVELESKKVEENVEIEVSEDGTEVEVKTDEGENVKVIDETEESETSEETEIEVPEEEIATENEEKDDSEFIEESFEKALTEYYKNNTKSIKNYKVEKITRNENEIKIEGLLTNKLGKFVKTELKANKVQEGKFYSRYEIAKIKGLLESKTSTDACMIVKTTKENKLECSSLANKKLVK